MSMSPMEPAFLVGVLTFHGHEEAERVVESLRGSDSLELVNDVSILEHRPDGRFSVHAYSTRPTEKQHVAVGAAVGGAVGALVLGPFGLLAGVLGGAGVGAAMGGDHRNELLLSDEFVQGLHEALPPGTSAVLIVGDKDPVEQVLGEMRSKGVVTAAEFSEPLSPAQSEALAKALAQGG
ncbi:MAG: DUF1269 domain-containing protein [Actinomycetota bacterium]